MVQSLHERLMSTSDMTDYLENESKQQPVCFEALTHFHRYWRSPRRDTYLTARRSLEDAFEVDPDWGESIACLSQIHTDGHRFGFSSASPSEEIKLALGLAARAVEVSPNSSQAYHAQGMALWFAGDARSSLVALRTACALNPNATEAEADLGLLSCLHGDWSDGVHLVQKALSNKVSQAGIQRVGIAFVHFLKGDFEEALAEAWRVHSPHITHGYVAMAVALIRLNRQDEAADAIRRILSINPYYLRNMLHEFGGDVVNPELSAEIIAALHDAGLTKESARPWPSTRAG
jgi:tetratricopeptide (TPR) repeat protein